MWIILGFYYQGFTEVQMSKLKKSEAFTREREREIEQVSLKKNISLMVPLINHTFLTAHVTEVCLLLCACCLKVVESVNELAQIMKDLSVLVIDQVYEILIHCQWLVLITSWGQTFDFFFEQGTIIDRIDYNIQNVAASVEEGYKELQKVLKPPLFSHRSDVFTL